ncbi:ROK family protein [Pedobacter sp.]|uniref:ROK family protein n=1 Tax=Pedobacter sp. TaxID=1411316 RepID=UPI003BABAC87
MSNNIILGVDIGGSHISSALVNIKNGKILDGTSFRKKIDAHAKTAEIISVWCEVIEKSLNTAEHSGEIGIAMPGPFDYGNGISYMKGMGKYDALYGLDVGQLLLKELGSKVKSLRFVNDAGCFLQGELSHGLAAPYSSVMGFTIGTGFGSARGISGLAKDANYWCHPFMGGICEDLFSSKWFVAKYNQYAGKTTTNVKELIENADCGNPLLQVFDEFSMNMGVFLTQIYKKENFDCVVLGGNISKASALFLPQLKYYLNTMSISSTVYISAKGEDAALIGAACSVG